MTSAPPGFGALILTHGRPEGVKATIGTLDRGGYTGPWWLVLDDEDSSADEYRMRWGSSRVLTFHKDDEAQDMGDNGGTRAVIVYARNATDHLAATLGLTHFIQLDDDYAGFAYRVASQQRRLLEWPTRHLDEVFAGMVRFLEVTGANAVAFAQMGDYIGGAAGKFYRKRLSRKAMNTFVCRTGSPPGFVGRVNEDVNTYTWRGHLGHLFLTISDLGVHQATTQAQDGGMSGIYLDSGTYAKSFYPVMWCPSSVKVAMMRTTHTRVHHRVKWGTTVPMILSDRWRKAD